MNVMTSAIWRTLFVVLLAVIPGVVYGQSARTIELRDVVLGTPESGQATIKRMTMLDVVAGSETTRAPL
jgi:p-aminobenzoyl-glutamate transporter AbgT